MAIIIYLNPYYINSGLESSHLFLSHTAAQSSVVLAGASEKDPIKIYESQNVRKNRTYGW